MAKLGILCYIWGIIFCYLETRYFGYNLIPQSKEEVICDITSILFIVVGGVLTNNKYKRQ